MAFLDLYPEIHFTKYDHTASRTAEKRQRSPTHWVTSQPQEMNSKMRFLQLCQLWYYYGSLSSSVDQNRTQCLILFLVRFFSRNASNLHFLEKKLPSVSKFLLKKIIVKDLYLIFKNFIIFIIIYKALYFLMKKWPQTINVASTDCSENILGLIMWKTREISIVFSLKLLIPTALLT